MSGRAGLVAVRSGRSSAIDDATSIAKWRGPVTTAIDAGAGWMLAATGHARAFSSEGVTVGLHGWIEGDDGERSTDAEWLHSVVVAHGPAALTHRRGGYAVVIIDATRGLAVAIRDFMGTRPLAWGAEGSVRAIASEPLQVPVLLGQHPANDERTTSHYLDTTKPPVDATFVEGARYLPPDSTLRVSDHHLVVVPRAQAIDRLMVDDDDALAGVRTRLDRAVATMGRGAQKLASHASGGVDSGVIAASASSQFPDVTFITHRVRGLTEADETDRAAQLAAYCRADHHIVEIDPFDTYERVRRDILIHAPSHPTMWLSGATITEAARHGHDRILVGQLGDEWLTMAGGPLAHAAWSRRLSPTLAFARYGVAHDGVRALEMAYLVARLVAGGLLRRRRYGPHVLATFAADSWVQRTITGTERLGTLNDIGVDFPFADWDYVRFVLGLDVWQRNRPGVPKRVLREAYSDVLPESYVDDPIKANFYRVPELAFGGRSTDAAAWQEIRQGWVDAWRAALGSL